jgi:hypothetical protein
MLLNTDTSCEKQIDFVDVSNLENVSENEIKLVDISEMKMLLRSDFKFFAFLRFTKGDKKGKSYIHVIPEGGKQLAICISKSRKDRGKRLRTFDSIISVVNAAKQMGFKSIVLDLDASNESTDTTNEFKGI